jgi:DNA-directed RNA polymerase
LGTSPILKQLGVLNAASDISARNTAKNDSETAVVTAEKDEEPKEKTLERPPTVAVLTKEQALQLLKPGREQAKRSKLMGRPPLLPEESLAGKFVNLVDLLPPVPAKGEFDVNKIKSSLYFFS